MVVGEGAGVVGIDADFVGLADGLFAGGEEEEFPAVDLLLVFNHVVDGLPGEALAGVFETVSEDGDDDGAGSLGLGESGEALT